ncbi:hypothetical protein [Streptomyces sp. NPDC058272]|uniref:hypothetical protein n=1 Tax=Streptomyces sp. NPDC058272 TaxID=3346415 RepID=UPI0036E5BBB9
MAKVISNGGMTVELSGREVDLIRQALDFSVSNNGDWFSSDDEDARSIERSLARGVE